MLFVVQFYDVALVTGAGDKHRYSGGHSRPHWKISCGSERSQSPRSQRWVRGLGEIPGARDAPGGPCHRLPLAAGPERGAGPAPRVHRDASCSLSPVPAANEPQLHVPAFALNRIAVLGKEEGDE